METDRQNAIVLIIPHIFFNVKEIERKSMKICAIICEYNPFHNGHLYQLREAKRLSGADAVLCIMSGNFVQRGEPALLNKYTRARHAVMAGADIVLELPTVFATSNAEIFAKGAISILSSIPSVSTLCFGAETADKAHFLRYAELLSHETKEISQKIKEYTADGISYAKARALAYKDEIPESVLCFPNNILGLEYTKAILNYQANIEILPILRNGNGYKDKVLTDTLPSATAIRNSLENKDLLKGKLPDFVITDLPKENKNELERLEKYALLSKTAEEIKQVCDCTEGLENAFKKIATTNQPIVESLTSSRYTSSRIRRIALQNLLNIPESLIRDCLQSNLYLSVLAVNKAREDLLSALGKANVPLLIRAKDEKELSDTAIECLRRTRFADDVYNLLYPEQTIEKNIFI